jgi:hypothetical protein
VEENEEQVEPPPNFFNNKEVSIKSHSFVTIPLEIHHKTQVSFLQCLEVLSYAIIFKNLCTEGHKSRNNLPKKIRLSKKIGYLRWQILKKKGWNGLIGHPYEWRKCGMFYFLHSIFESFSFCHFIFILFCF